MNTNVKPHDLLWITPSASLFPSGPVFPDWVAGAWDHSLPVIVRRDYSSDGKIPVGIRGQQRGERAAAWLEPDSVVRQLTPDALIRDPHYLARFDTCDLPPLRLLRTLIRYEWPWSWGIGGSSAYSLATGRLVMNAQSDLDVLIPMPVRPEPGLFDHLLTVCRQSDCRVDIQLETPLGGCALVEWLKGRQVMIKTNTGPVLVRDPWEVSA